jgi:hypothetical protein
MKLRELNALTALLSLGGSLVWFAIGQSASGLIWLACSLVWSALAAAHLRSSTTEPNPLRRVGRRLSRLLLWS